MGTAGRTRRVTDNVTQLKGTQRKGRHGAADQKVKRPSGRPICPQWLPPYGKQEWKRVIPLLDEMGVLSKSDATILTQYCALFADFKLSTMGKRYRTIVTKGGDMFDIPSPFTAAEHTQLRQCAQQLGLTVLARQTIKLPKGKKTNRFEGL